MPRRFEKLCAVGSSPSSVRAPAVMARAMGCSDELSSAPATRNTSSWVSPAAGVTAASVMVPVVTVPVLSTTTVSTRRVDSRISGPLMTMPNCAPRPVPTISAVGVASPSAQGHAMISTATAAVNAVDTAAPETIQNPRVATARAMTIGTKTPEIRSASRCAGALPFCACSTSRAICASCVSEPTRSAWTTRTPSTLTVAPTT